MALSRQLFVRNLPYQAKDEDLIQSYSGYASVKRAFVVLDPVTKTSRGFGYVTFETPDDAEKARKASVELFGRILQAKPADQKPLRQKKNVAGPARNSKVNDSLTDESASDAADDVDGAMRNQEPQKMIDIREGIVCPVRHSDRRRCISIRLLNASHYKLLKTDVLSKLASCKLVSVVQPPSDVGPGDKAEVLLECPSRAAAVDSYMQLKEHREHSGLGFTFSYMELQKKPEEHSSAGKDHDVKDEPIEDASKNPNGFDGKDNAAIKELKKFRLIIRNLPFSISEKVIAKKCQRFGKVLEIVLPKKPDGKAKGFGFIQFSDQRSALKALRKINNTELEGRTVAVDWAIPKGLYEQQQQLEVSDADDMETSTGETSTDGKVDIEKSDGVENLESEKTVKQQPEKVKPLPSHDIPEGRTVFIRGVPFSVNDIALKEFFEKLFGPVFYAKVCLMEDGRSKGTGFVKFVDKNHADECIKQCTETPVMFEGRRLTVNQALDRKEAENVRSEQAKLKQENDPRNLRLAIHGYIKIGSPEAEGLSPIDLQKRRALHAANAAKLKNPLMFVSDTRLSVHNIPTNVDDKKLKEIILKTLNDKSARVTECRIMRDLNRPNASGLAKSRGYAFVSFKEHNHALAALEKLNNNPEIFGENKRLIVQFSIENRKIIDRKKQNLEKSREHLKHKVEACQKGKGSENDKNSAAKSVKVATAAQKSKKRARKPKKVKVEKKSKVEEGSG